MRRCAVLGCAVLGCAVRNPRTARSLRFALARVLCGLGLLLVQTTALALPVRVDRAAAVFYAPEIGGVKSPRFIWERELGFLARLEALADAAFYPTAKQPFSDRHVRAALERRIAESLLEALEMQPEPTPAELTERTAAARLRLVQRVGGDGALMQAARAEGVSDGELWRLFRREARASLYLDRMVTPMLNPSEAELRNLHRGGQVPFADLGFSEAREKLQRWYVSRRLAAATGAFYDAARSRVRVRILRPLRK